MGQGQKKSIITGGEAVRSFVKGGVTYFTCKDTGTIFCKALDQSEKVGGIHEEGRNNEPDNIERIRRIKQITGKDNPRVLDFGCANGYFLKDLNNNGCIGFGYDPYVEGYTEITKEVDCISAIEVIEHFSEPFNEFDMMLDALVSGGKCYFETSFSDWHDKDSFYITPEVGHSTIWSHKGLDYMMEKKGFKIEPHINRNVRIYSKP